MITNKSIFSALCTVLTLTTTTGCHFKDPLLERVDQSTSAQRDMSATDLSLLDMSERRPDAMSDMLEADLDAAVDASLDLSDDMPDTHLDMSPSTRDGLFVDCEANEAGEGTSPDDPITTLASLQDMLRANPLSPGQGIYFRSGSRCEGSLSMIVRDQADGAEPIVISTYGGDTPATIDVSKRVDTWTRSSDLPSVEGVPISYLEDAPIYTVSEPERITQIFRDGARLPLAARADACNMRTPWIAQRVSPYDDADPMAARTVTLAQDDRILIYPTTSTMRAVLRLSDFEYGVANQVSGLSSDTRQITLEDMPRAFSSGYAIELQNWLPLLTCDGEWMQDDQTAYLFALALGDIRVSTRDPGQSESALEGADGIQLRLGQHAHVAISHLRIERAARAGIWVRPIAGQQGQLTLEDVHIEDPAVNAVNTSGIEATAITASTMSGAPSDCVRVGQQQVLSVTESTFSDCGFVHSQDVLGMQFSGISVDNVENVAVSSSRFARMGFAAVSMSGITGEGTVNQNVIEDYCLALDDCGAIYTHGGRDISRVADGQIRYANNLIIDGFGDIEGTPESSSGERSASGIYLDWRRSGVTVDRNVIVNARSSNGAIFIHGGQNNTISRNTIIQRDATGLAAAILTEDLGTQAPTPMSGNVLTDNLIYIESRKRGVIRLTDSVTGEHDTRPGGMIDMINNALYNPLIEETLLLDTRDPFGPDVLTSSHSNLSLENELAGIYEASPSLNGTHSVVLVNKEKSPRQVGLEQAYCDLEGTPVIDSATVPGQSAVVLLRCFCNQDGVCNNNEEASSCPEDCASTM